MPSHSADVPFRTARGRRTLYGGLLIAAAALLPAIMVNAAPLGPPQATGETGLVQPIAVFGTDERRALPQSHRALSASIGLLYERRSHSVCTAFCVDDSIVATAGHCIYRTNGERAPTATGFTFRLPAQRGAKATRI